MLTLCPLFHTVAYEELLDDHKLEGGYISSPLSSVAVRLLGRRVREYRMT